jgi:hypothetical protein
MSAVNTGLPSGAGRVSFEPLFSRKQEKNMERLGRSFAATLLLLSMTAVTLADGQMDATVTNSTTTQTNATDQGQTDTPPATSSTTAIAGQMDATLTEAGLTLFQTFSSVL